MNPRSPDVMIAESSAMQTRMTIGIALLGLIIFSIDMMLPLGIAAPVAYVGILVLTLWFPKSSPTLIAAATATMLTIIGFFGSKPGAPLWMAVINRSLVIAVIWITATLVLLHKKAREELRTLRQWLAVCASCKKIRDDQGFWLGLERYVEEHSDVLFTYSLCPDCTEKWYPELYPQLAARHPEVYKEQP